ncbi:hypothetical protein HII36_11400 [Nonomuraea sp. NN258]|nr:hypothetical protein [Nonomuraea antri]
MLPHTVGRNPETGGGSLTSRSILGTILIILEQGADRHDNGRALRIAYLDWVHTARSQLRRQTSNADLDRLVTTPRYVPVLSMQIPEPVWESHPGSWGSGAVSRLASSPDTTAIHDMILLEVAEHIEQLKKAFETLSAWSNLLDQPERSGPLVIADSNVFCHHPDRLNTWDVGKDVGAPPSQDVHLILPLAVLDELDRQKRSGSGRRLYQCPGDDQASGQSAPPGSRPPAGQRSGEPGLPARRHHDRPLAGSARPCAPASYR